MADGDQLKRKFKSLEGKIATLSAINSALQSENDGLKAQLVKSSRPTTATGAAPAPETGGVLVPILTPHRFSPILTSLPPPCRCIPGVQRQR